MWSPIVSGSIQPSLVINTDCLCDDGGGDYVNDWVLGFKIYEAVVDVPIDDSFVFLTHMPATIRSVLAGFHLQENGLAIIEEVDQDVYL